MLLIPGGSSFLSPTRPTTSARIAVLGTTASVTQRVETLKDIRQDAKALKQSWTQAPVAPAFSLPSLNSILDRFLAWLSGATPPAQPPRGRTTFNVSSFNILGSLHTAGGKGGYADGPTRAAWAAQVIEQRGVDVVGFQEMDNSQVTAFQRASGGQFGIYPGNTLGKWGSQTSIAWRKDTWELVKAEHHEMPFLNGMRRQAPVVLLRHKQTGQQAYFTNFHNAPHRKKGPDQQQYRDAATDKQIALINRLKRESGLPVIVTGDMNEKQNYFKRMTREADMTSANFGPIAGVPKRTGIDWIFGSDRVTFKNFVRDRSPLVAKTTDHPVLVSQVRIG